MLTTASEHAILGSSVVQRFYLHGHVFMSVDTRLATQGFVCVLCSNCVRPGVTSTVGWRLWADICITSCCCCRSRYSAHIRSTSHAPLSHAGLSQRAAHVVPVWVPCSCVHGSFVIVAVVSNASPLHTTMVSTTMVSTPPTYPNHPNRSSHISTSLFAGTTAPTRRYSCPAPAE